MADAVGEEDAIPAPKLKEKVQKHMEYAQRKQSKDLLGVLLLLAMTLCLLLQNTWSWHFACCIHQISQEEKKASNKEANDGAAEQAVLAANASTGLAASVSRTAMAAAEKSSNDSSSDEQ